MARAAYDCDVLVVGGGLGGCWAAIAAARCGARVILADKGYVGTSGVTATAGPGHWWVPPDPPELRHRAITERAERGLGLADPDWMARIIDLTWKSLPGLSRHYAFPTIDGVTHYRGMRGPEYMRAMRAIVIESGVRILDQSPVEGLLVDAEGTAAGAFGVHRQRGEAWEVRSGAVVITTGGCAFFSHLLGSRTNTGDGYLMAAEAGAELSGMEFSAYYTVAPARSTMTRSMAYSFARYFDDAGRELDIQPGPGVNAGLARAMTRGKVFCKLDRVPQDIQDMMAHVQPNFVIPFDRWGIDPYRERFEVTLHGEGTVRGVGGLAIIDDNCQTRVPGLFAAGDAATREKIAGAVSGGGAQNSAWALSSGQWAGQGAARYARHHTTARRVEPATPVVGTASDVSVAEVVTAVRDEMETPMKNMFRDEAQLRTSLERMDSLWSALQHQRGGWQVRELRASVATARWCLTAALARGESRGMHVRIDRPDIDPAQAHHVIVLGLESISVRSDAVQTSQAA